MKVPGPDHPIRIERTSGQVRIHVGSAFVADSTQALTLQEADYPPVQYIPRADVDMTRLSKTDHVTHCPYKGDASYFSIAVEGQTIPNAAWSYEAPYPAMQEIAGHLAFYPDKITLVMGSD